MLTLFGGVTDQGEKDEPEKECVFRSGRRSGESARDSACIDAALLNSIDMNEHTGTVFGAINRKQFEAIRALEL